MREEEGRGGKERGERREGEGRGGERRKGEGRGEKWRGGKRRGGVGEEREEAKIYYNFFFFKSKIKVNGITSILKKQNRGLGTVAHRVAAERGKGEREGGRRKRQD